MSEETSNSNGISGGDDTKEQNDRDKELASFETLEGVDTRKMLTIVNHFVTTTTGFLNRLSRVSEERLQKVSRDISRIDVKLKVLEAKLASIKGLESTTADPVPGDSKTEQKEEVGPTTTTTTTAKNDEDEMVELNSKTCGAAYTKFFKMVEMMIPLEAVKLKCASAGLDPTLLDKFGQKVTISIAQGNTLSSSSSNNAALEDKPVVETTTGTEIVPVDETTAAPSKVEEEEVPVMKLKDDPTYKQYFRMMKIRVPIPHIKAKMAAHGLDPSIIDMDPEGPSPSAGSPVARIEDA